MSDNKNYYYMRLKEDFFDSDEMKLLEGEKPDGWMYSNILLKMYLRSLKSDGRLMLNGVIPYNAKMIASITGHSVGVVEKALNMFEALGLIEKLDNGAIYMLNIQNFIGKSSTEADRKKEYRRTIKLEKNKLLEKNQKSDQRQMSDERLVSVGHLSDEHPPEIEIDKEIEIDNILYCPEAKPPEQQKEVFIKIPLSNGDEYPIYRDDIDNFRSLYPSVDIEQTIRNMRGWIDCHSERKLTLKSIRKFVNSWLANEVSKEKQMKKNPVVAGGRKNKFNNFPQREYDYTTLEKQLMKKHTQGDS